MSPAQKLGLPHWLPPFCWSEPWQWFLWTAGITTGVLLVCWWGLERVVWRQYYISNVWGDAIGLPLIAAGSAMIIKGVDERSSRWYTSPKWYIGLYLVLTVGWLLFTFGADKSVNRAQRLSPSSLYHTAFWPYFAFIVFAAAPYVLAHMSWKPFVLIALGVAVWFGTTVLHDMRQSPPPLGGGVEFHWDRFFTLHPSTIRVDQWQDAGKLWPRDYPEWFWVDWNRDGTHK